MLVGHAHVEIPQRFVASKVTPGKQVLLSEPLKWGMRLTVMEFELEQRKGDWHLSTSRSTTLNANTVTQDAAVAALVAEVSGAAA